MTMVSWSGSSSALASGIWLMGIRREPSMRQMAHSCGSRTSSNNGAGLATARCSLSSVGVISCTTQLQVASEHEPRRLRRIDQRRQYRFEQGALTPAILAHSGAELRAHHRLVAGDHEQPAADLELAAQLFRQYGQRTGDGKGVIWLMGAPAIGGGTVFQGDVADAMAGEFVRGALDEVGVDVDAINVLA